MSQYKSKPTVLAMAPEAIAAKFEDLSGLSEYVSRIPEAERAQIGDLAFEPDAIVIKNPQIGEMKFTVTERSPERIVFNANGMLPLALIVDLKSLENGLKTEATTTVDVEIPAIVRPFIGGKIQQVADAFGDMMAKLAGNDSF